MYKHIYLQTNTQEQMRNKDANLIPLQPVQECDADDSGLDTRVMGQRGEG